LTNKERKLYIRYCRRICFVDIMRAFCVSQVIIEKYNEDQKIIEDNLRKSLTDEGGTPLSIL